MSRKSIFEMLADNWDLHEEISKIDQILTSYIFTGPYRGSTAPELIDEYTFGTWKQRNRCLNFWEFRNRLGISNILNEQNPSVLDVLIYLEYACNMHYLIIKTRFWCTLNEDTISMLSGNITAALEHLGYEEHFFDEEEKVILVEKDAAATAVAEIADEALAKKVIEYNHFILKGKLTAKKDILIALAAELEPQRAQIKSFNQPLERDLFMLFNKMNIRHNNREPGTNFVPYVAKLSDRSLEVCYDEIYQMALLARLSIDHQIQRKQKVDALKKKILNTN